MKIRWLLICACLGQTAQAQSLEDIKSMYGNSKNWIQQKLNGDNAKENTIENKNENASTTEDSSQPAEPKFGEANPVKAEKPRAAGQDNPSKKPGTAVADSQSWTRYLLLQHAEDQDLLMEIVEEINFGDTSLISNELSLGLFFGKNLLTTQVAFVYGSTSLSHEDILDNNVATAFEANHTGLAYGLRYSREVRNFIFPYIGLSWAHFDSDISQKIKLRVDEDSVNFPLETYDLKQIDMTSLALGVDLRAHFWKVFTVGTGTGVEIPIRVTEPSFKNEEGASKPEFQAAANELAKKLKQPLIHINIHFGFAF